MKIHISKHSPKPIYEQISSQIKNLILNNKLKPGDKLPSMRELAKILQVSVITTQKAYEELLEDNHIETIVGKGTFVKKSNTSFILDEQYKELEDKMEETVRLAKQYKIKEEYLIQLVKEFYRGEDIDG
ncbi:GntR family transcriptional regulator [Miniphocaeibacter halophilus]|uniref:GntR family transcriptional regulator n=1 Tax=Miniphocaeibacter halophilus TaxID=2931922 RepID=A0AC61MTW3_9FIRM|nr:GntR family transcriptional regulator [Miniphocaeibacter halophilus]QQK09002.1 GntR family transcriptional regulator [Miniphocaeibacter halophilus]